MTDLKNTPVPKRFKILLIGDSCVDEYFIGHCERLSPEAPVPVLKVNNKYSTKGMAANVKTNLTSLNQIVDFITNDNIIKKTRFIDKKSGQHLLRVDDETKTKPWNGHYLYRTIQAYDAVVISDYNKGFLNYEHIEKIIKDFSIPIFIDTKKTDIARFEGAWIKINFKEYNDLISTPADNKGLIVTNGENGAMYNLKHYPAKRVEVSDVCGAGDTFLASLAYAYLQFGCIDKAIEFAICASSLSVQHRGNYAPKLEEITTKFFY